ncbi:MAG TPA: fatty-acid oxidation protein subunit alpha, partial [Cyanobacteria bacterium UBA11162]|nr:fatty-acid oxidation protein subunit alpha [Cyanobacteria bacterium UBA11162]
MSAKDIYHSAVRSALIKEGWIITHDPLTLEFEDVTLFVDLGAEQFITAERGKEKIAVEIKSFIRESMVSEFHTAAGQFINYRLALSELEPERVLYLAIPNDAYETFFSKNTRRL